jgi:hypothetical protein
MVIKKISSYQSDRDGKSDIFLKVVAKNRELAWTEITNIGGTVIGCTLLNINQFKCNGKIENASLIQIEQLERDGWTW